MKWVMGSGTGTSMVVAVGRWRTSAERRSEAFGEGATRGGGEDKKETDLRGTSGGKSCGHLPARLL